jgi:Flp pilus assembly protein TadG
MRKRFGSGLRTTRGAAAVEFAVVAAVFFTLLIGIVEMGRILFYWNTVTEATRLGARMAVVCDMNDPDIAARMAQLMPQVAGNVTITYLPSGCGVNTCQEVAVEVAAGVQVPTFIPYLPLTLQLPAFRTTLPRESMQSTFGGSANPVCL